MLKNNNLKIYYLSILRLANFSFIELNFPKKHSVNGAIINKHILLSDFILLLITAML